MERYVMLYKQEGESPLQAIARLRAERPELAGVRMTYAGRLDPMASGSLLILLGETYKERDAFTALDKTYRFRVLYGVATDTLDILGVVSSGAPAVVEDLAAAVQKEEFSAPYPAFSSKKVAGKPLFQHALDGTLHTIAMPHTEMVVRDVSLLGITTMDRDALLVSVMERLSRMQAGPVNDFRIDAVRASWQTIAPGDYVIAEYRALVQSGTYIRTLCERAGKRAGCGAIALTIERERFSLPPLHASTRILCTDSQWA